MLSDAFFRATRAHRAIVEMNGQYCGTRAMRISPATPKQRGGAGAAAATAAAAAAAVMALPNHAASLMLAGGHGSALAGLSGAQSTAALAVAAAAAAAAAQQQHHHHHQQHQRHAPLMLQSLPTSPTGAGDGGAAFGDLSGMLSPTSSTSGSSFNFEPGSSANDPNNTKVFVGGLASHVTEDELREHFSPIGEIVYVKIPIGKGCGFVHYATRALAEKAIATLNGTNLGGSPIRLSWARSASDKQRPLPTGPTGVGSLVRPSAATTAAAAAAAAAALQSLSGGAFDGAGLGLPPNQSHALIAAAAAAALQQQQQQQQQQQLLQQNQSQPQPPPQPTQPAGLAGLRLPPSLNGLNPMMPAVTSTAPAPALGPNVNGGLSAAPDRSVPTAEGASSPTAVAISATQSPQLGHVSVSFQDPPLPRDGASDDNSANSRISGSRSTSSNSSSSSSSTLYPTDRLSVNGLWSYSPLMGRSGSPSLAAADALLS